jgi:uncharacterized protein YprB with RNaseH-like and TPR domain
VGLPDGRVLRTREGPVFFRTVSYPLRHRHGSIPLEGLKRIRPEGLALLAHDPAFGDIRPDGLLFLDVETTGLMSGAGLLIFLVGVGYLRKDRVVVDQYFLQDPADEPAFLAAILSPWRSRPTLVTYNGRQFDQPRIRDRLQFHRMEDRIPRGHHLDLYLLARRTWKGALPSLGLQDLETEILGHHRVDDLPGYLCPAVYADYLGGRPSRMEDVFRHNLEDILSLATLTIRLDGVARSPEDSFEEAAVAIGLDRAGRQEEAMALYESVWRRRPRGMPMLSVGRRLAAIRRRRGNLDGAVAIWRRLWNDGDLRSARSLAIALEHHVGDLEGAEGVVLEAFRMIDGLTPAGRADWEKRLARIRRKRKDRRV